MNEAGIYKPTDLIEFPWDKEPTTPVSKADIDELQADMAAYNQQLAEQNDTQS